jgi:hypothetical protein
MSKTGLTLFDGTLLAILFVALTALVLTISKLAEYPKGRYYDCSLAEISPDFPDKVRQECRKLRSEAYKNGRI